MVVGIVVFFINLMMWLFVFGFFLLKLIINFVIILILDLIIFFIVLLRGLWLFWYLWVNFKLFLLGVFIFKNIVLRLEFIINCINFGFFVKLMEVLVVILNGYWCFVC